MAVVPTRELALQMAAEAAKLARFLPVDEACIYGGTRFPAQVNALRTAAIVVGTPGRLLDHLGRGTLRLDHIDTVVLDEVDRMYDLGFREDVDKLLRYASARKQTLLLSATLNEDVQRLIAKHLPEHERFEVQSSSLTVDEVQQTFYVVDRDRKLDLLMAVAADRNPTRCIVFVRTKFSADRVAYRLQQQGFHAQEIHSGLVQSRREQILQGFRDGALPDHGRHRRGQPRPGHPGRGPRDQPRHPREPRGLRPPRGPHRAHGQEGLGDHLRHARRRGLPDDDREADQQGDPAGAVPGLRGHAPPTAQRGHARFAGRRPRPLRHAPPAPRTSQRRHPAVEPPGATTPVGARLRRRRNHRQARRRR